MDIMNANFCNKWKHQIIILVQKINQQIGFFFCIVGGHKRYSYIEVLIEQLHQQQNNDL
jgi:hypothetical protein